MPTCSGLTQHTLLIPPILVLLSVLVQPLLESQRMWSRSKPIPRSSSLTSSLVQLAPQLMAHHLHHHHRQLHPQARVVAQVAHWMHALIFAQLISLHNAWNPASAAATMCWSRC